MFNGIAPADWPSNMGTEDRKAWMRDLITKWSTNKKIEEALTAAELGNLSHMQKSVAYRSLLIIGSIRHCHANKRADARIPILTLITYLSDNAKGICSLTITRMMELFARTRQCILDNIEALEADGLIGVARVDGMPNVYWPRIPAALAEINPNPVWFVEALTTTPKSRIFGDVNEAIAAATNQSSSVNRSSGVDRYQSSGLDPTGPVNLTPPVKSSPGTGLFEHDSISSLNLFSPTKAACGGICNRGPHLSDAGFVISSEHKMIISLPTFEGWRHRFSAIQDLEAKLQRLAAVILKKGIMHPGWTSPEAWMVGCLAEDNQKAIDAARITDAKVASAQRGQPTKTFRR
jgi:hypothetical protein